MDGRDSEAEEGLPGIPFLEARMAKTRNHTYKKMIEEAIHSMRERRGSSRQAIVKFLNNNYALKKGSTTRINSVLNKMVQRRDLVQTRGTGANGSFKINTCLVPHVSAGKRGRSRGRRRKKRKGKKGRKGKKRGRSRRRRRGKKGKKGKGKRGGKRKGRRGGKRRKGKKGRKGRKGRGRGKRLRSTKRRSLALSNIPVSDI